MTPPDDRPATHVSRRVAVEHIMGTVISIDARDPVVSNQDFEDVIALLRRIDEQFSPFRTDSEVTRLADGRLSFDAVSSDMREVLSLCEQVRAESGGAFDINKANPKGRFDPSGLVKGWAADRAVALLLERGWRNFCVNAGGDVVARGEPVPGRPWRIGIRHPIEADKVAAVVFLRDHAVATSGAYERGDHIVDPHSALPPCDLLSISVIGPALTLSDAYATAAFVKGRDGPQWIASFPGYECFAATADGRAISTPGCAALLDEGDRDA